MEGAVAITGSKGMSGIEAVLLSSKYKYCLSECKRDKWFVFSLGEMVRFVSVCSIGAGRHDCDSKLRAIFFVRTTFCCVRLACVPDDFVVVYRLL